MSEKAKRRGVILFCAAICGAITASLNCWSVFQKPMMEAYGFTPQELSLAYTLVIFFIGSVGGPVGGWLQRKIPASRLMLISGIGFGLGWFITGFVSSFPVLCITFGLLVGVCDGIAYNLSLAVATRWYPDKRGFANGFALAIMAIYPLFTAPAANMLIEQFNVQLCFNIVGIFCMVMFIIFSRVLSIPDADYKPEGWEPPAEDTTKVNVKNYSAVQMMKTPFFYFILLFFGMTACTGVVMLSTVSLVGQVQAGMDAATGSLMVGIFGIANALGRFGGGSLSDKIGRFQTLYIVVAITGVLHLFFYANATTIPTFIAESCVLGFCFGTLMAIIPSLIGDTYGPANMGQNFGIVFFGYTIASLIGPQITANTLATTGSYSAAFPLLGVLCVVGLVLLTIAWYFYKKQKAADAA